MAISVSQTVVGTLQSTSTPTISIPTAPAAGEVVYLMGTVTTSGARNATAISGLGATWITVYQPGQNAFIVVGTGATSSGTVTVTLDGFATVKLDAYVVAGVTQSTAVEAAYGTGTTGPSIYARDGQLVLQQVRAVGNLTLTNGSATAPTTGWTVNSSTGDTTAQVSGARRIATESTRTTHRVDLTESTASAGRLSTIAAFGIKTGKVGLRGKTVRRYPGSPTQNSSITIPANVQAGDLLVLAVSWYDLLTTPSGWTLQGSVAFSSTPNPKSYVFTRTAQAGDAGSAVPLNGSATTNGGSAAILAYANVGSFSFTQSAQQTTSSVSIPARTMSSVDSMFVYGVNTFYSAGSGANMALDAATGQIARYRVDWTTDSTSFFLVTAGDEEPGATGTTGTRSATSNTTPYSAAWSMELVPTATSTTVAVGRATATTTASAITPVLLPQTRSVGLATASALARPMQVVMFGKVLLLDPGQPVPDGTPVGTLIFRKA